MLEKGMMLVALLLSTLSVLLLSGQLATADVPVQLYCDSTLVITCACWDYGNGTACSGGTATIIGCSSRRGPACEINNLIPCPTGGSGTLGIGACPNNFIPTSASCSGGVVRSC